MATSLKQALLSVLPRALGQQIKVCHGKHRFPTREAAAGMQAGNGWKLQTYECDICGGWHLTRRLQWHGGTPR